MTDDRSADWDDARLAAGFQTRAAAHPTPPDLAAASIDRLRGSVRTEPGRPRLRLISWAAAASAVAVLATVVTVGGPATKPGATLSPGATVTPPDLPVISVGEAIAVRDVEKSDREIAVRGYFARPRAAMRCVALGLVENPVRLECPETFQWLLGTPEPLNSITSVLPAGRVGFQPMLPFVDTGALNRAADVATAHGSLVEVVFIGHFHDRRGHSSLCGTGSDTDCDGFVVDGIRSVGGEPVPASTVINLEPYAAEPRPEPVWTPTDVDRLLLAVGPHLEILSRVALPGHRIHELEPSLGTGALGIIDRPIAWVVTGLDPSSGARGPVRRTFLLVDGTAEAYEAVPFDVDDVGFVPFTLVGTPLASDHASPTPAAPSSPTPMAGPEDAPSMVLGIPVISVSEAVERLSGEVDDTELAVRGYYVPPSSVVHCTNMPADANPLRRSCSEGSRWLMEAPEQLEDPASGERHAPTSAALNPVIADDVQFPFDTPVFEARPSPQPVVVLGHFADRRSHDFDAAKRFVVDALVWRSGRLIPGSTVESISQVETQGVAVDRVERALGPAAAIWTRLISPVELKASDPDAMRAMPELASASAVWIVRRLVDQDGRQVVRTAFTAEGSDRVWADVGQGVFDLATTIEIEAGAGDGGVVTIEVVDSSHVLAGARRPTDAELAAASFAPRLGSEFVTSIELASVADSESGVIVRWMGGMCDRRWELGVYRAALSGPVTLYPFRQDGHDSCRLLPLVRSVVLEFDAPISADDILLETSPSGG